MRLPLLGAPFVVLFSAISVHAHEHPLLMDNPKDGGQGEVDHGPESPELQDALPQDADFHSPEGELRHLLEEAQQRAAMPKARGKRGILLGIVLILGLLLYGAIAAKRNSNVINGVIDVLTSSKEDLATKARALGMHVLNPTALSSAPNVLLVAYAAAWVLLLSSLFEFIKTKGLIKKLKKVHHDLTELPELPPDMRPRNLLGAGAVVTALSSLGLVLNLHPSLFYFSYVGLGIFAAGVLLTLGRMFEDKLGIKDVLFPAKGKSDSMP